MQRLLLYTPLGRDLNHCMRCVCPRRRPLSHITAAQRPTLHTEVPRLNAELDDELSKRPLSLDAAGYFVIRIDRQHNEIVADFYTNTINKNGTFLGFVFKYQIKAHAHRFYCYKHRHCHRHCHYSTGLACDPETGQVIPCTPGYVRAPSRVYRGQTAKEISVSVLEQHTTDGRLPPCTHLEHANYLGREFQRAEFALLTGQDYIQD